MYLKFDAQIKKGKENALKNIQKIGKNTISMI